MLNIGNYFNLWVKCWGSPDAHYVSNCLFWSQIRKKNVLKDFVTIAGPLGVTHFIIFSKTPTSVNMVSHWVWGTLQFCCVGTVTPSIQQHISCAFQRLARLPKGPTLHFKVLKVNIWTCKENIRTLKKWAQMMTDWYLTVSDVFKVNALKGPNWKSHL